MNDHEIQELLELAASEGLTLPWPPGHVFSEEDEDALIAILTNRDGDALPTLFKLPEPQ